MKQLILLFPIFLIVAICKGQTPVQLAPPLLKYQSVFFKKSAKVELEFAQQGTQIYYTLNNRTPTLKDKVYRKPIQIKKSFTTLKAMVAGDGFGSSEIVNAIFIKDGLSIQSVQQTPANERFPGNGANTLIDNEGGLPAIGSGSWLGYQQDSVEVNIVMEGKPTLSSVLVNSLQDQGSWVFLPEQIRVYQFDESSQSFQLVGERLNQVSGNIPGASCVPIQVPFSKKIVSGKIKIIIRGMKSLPEWHPGKGQQGWLFIDEIKLY